MAPADQFSLGRGGTLWDAGGLGFRGWCWSTAVARTRRSSSCNSVHVPRVNYHCGAGCARAFVRDVALDGLLEAVEPTERGWASSRKRLTPARTAALATCCSNGRSIPLLFRRKKQRQIEGPCRSSATSSSRTSQMALCSILNGVCTHSTSTAPVRKKSGINRINHRASPRDRVPRQSKRVWRSHRPQRAQTCDAASRG